MRIWNVAVFFAHGSSFSPLIYMLFTFNCRISPGPVRTPLLEIIAGASKDPEKYLKVRESMQVSLKQLVKKLFFSDNCTCNAILFILIL